MAISFKEFAQQSILVIGFLGAVVFASLVFVLGQRQEIISLFNAKDAGYGNLYFQSLVIVMMMDSIIFILLSLRLVDDASKVKEAKYKDWVNSPPFWLFVFGITGLLILFPLLLWPFTVAGAILIIFFEIGVMFYAFGERPSIKMSSQNKKHDETK